MQITPEEEQRFFQLCLMAFDFARNDDDSNLALMLDAGLNVNLKTHKGDSLLMLASYNNALKTASLLLKRGANVDEVNARGQTPLAGVCFKGYTQMAKLLMSYGANLHKNIGLGMTPYRFAILFGHFKMAKTLNQNSKRESLPL